MTLHYPSSGSLALSPNRPQWRALAGLPKPRLASRCFPRGLGASTPRPVMRAGRVGRMAFGRTRGMGAGTQAGVVAGSAILSAAPMIGPAAPFVAAAGELVSLISSFIGGGCGQPCVIAAQAEQIYEYAGQCLDAAAKAGQLGQRDLINGLETLLSAGQAHMQQIGGTSQLQKGETNLENALNSDIKAASSFPVTAPQPLNVSTAPALFPGTTGWYGASAQAGAQLALSYLQSLPAASGTVSAATGTISILGMNFSFTELLIFAGFAWLAYTFVE